MNAMQSPVPQFHGELLSHAVEHIQGTKPRQFRTIFQYPNGVRELDDSGWKFYSHDAHKNLVQARQGA